MDCDEKRCAVRHTRVCVGVGGFHFPAFHSILHAGKAGQKLREHLCFVSGQRWAGRFDVPCISVLVEEPGVSIRCYEPRSGQMVRGGGVLLFLYPRSVTAEQIFNAGLACGSR